MKTDELYRPQFFTATILKWKYLVVNDEFKNIIVDSLLFLKNEGSILVYAGLLVTTPTRASWATKPGLCKAKNYYQQHQIYYKNIRLLGLEYPDLDYSKALPFLLMLPNI